MTVTANGDELATACREVRAVLADWCLAYNKLFAGVNNADEVISRLSEKFVSQYGIQRVGPDLMPYSRDMETEGTLAAAAMYSAAGGCPWTIEHLHLLPRSEREVIASYEIRQSGPTFRDRGFALDVWRLESDGQWRIVRQTMEQAGTESEEDL